MSTINHPLDDVRTSFLQHPFVQNVLPFLTSLMTHAAILVIAIATYTVIKIQTTPTMMQPKPTQGIPGMLDPSMPNIPVAHPGRGGDPLREWMQDKVVDVKVPGFTEYDGKEMLSMLATGGGENDDSSSKIIGLGAGKGFGKGPGYGPGNGLGGGTLPYGPPGGGIPGIVGLINNHGTGGRIVFICDATGSMMSEFDNLRVELRKTIDGLRPPKSFNVVFFQENAPPPLDKNLLFATPSNKQRMYDYIDKYTPRGRTDPKPGIVAAFAMHPDLIFFLCDPSDFPDPKGTIEMFKSLNAANYDGKCRVNTIDFMGDLQDKPGEALLKQISADSHGTFSYVSEKDLGN